MLRRGADVRITVDGVAFAVSRVRVGDRTTAQNVSNSEGVCGNPLVAPALGFVTKTPDLREGSLEMTAVTFDDENNPFSAPLSFTSGNWYQVSVFPAGLAGPFHDLGNILLTNVTHEFNIPGLQPVNLTFESDGLYVLAGEGA